MLLEFADLLKNLSNIELKMFCISCMPLYQLSTVVLNSKNVVKHLLHYSLSKIYTSCICCKIMK